MSLKRIIGSTLKVPLFFGLDRDRMARLVNRAERVVYQPGEKLIESGDYGDAAILVVSGHATQINALSSLHPYDPIEPGALVGEMAMLIETQHHLTVVADSTVQAVKFTRTMIQAEMGEDPPLADHFVQRIAERLHNLAAEMRAYEGSTANAPSSDGTEHSTTDIIRDRADPSTFPVN